MLKMSVNTVNGSSVVHGPGSFEIQTSGQNSFEIQKSKIYVRLHEFVGFGWKYLVHLSWKHTLKHRIITIKQTEAAS